MSRQTTADLPDERIFGLAAGGLSFVAAGWVAMIRPLPPGTHTIRIAQVLPDGTSAVTGVNVKVVRRR